MCIRCRIWWMLETCLFLMAMVFYLLWSFFFSSFVRSFCLLSQSNRIKCKISLIIVTIQTIRIIIIIIIKVRINFYLSWLYSQIMKPNHRKLETNKMLLLLLDYRFYIILFRRQNPTHFINEINTNRLILSLPEINKYVWKFAYYRSNKQMVNFNIIWCKLGLT